MKIDDIYRKIVPKKFLDIEPTDLIEDTNMISYIVLGVQINALKVISIPEFEASEIKDFQNIKNTYRTDTTRELFYLQRVKFDISDFSKYQILDVVIDKSQKTWLVKEVTKDVIIVQKFPLLLANNTEHEIKANNISSIKSVWEVRI